MRTLTSQEMETLSSPSRGTWLRVRVRRPDGTDVNLSALLGEDWLLGVSWNESTDQPVAQANVSVRRNGPGGEVASLSPMAVDSLANLDGTGAYVPLLLEGRQFRVDVATLPLGQVPDAGHWREVFFGRIDSVDFGPEELRFDGRDYYGGLLQDTFIEVERNYGNDTTGVAAQTVMNQILAAEGLGDFGPYTPVDPLWQLGRYTQKRVPLYEALQQLANQLGWEVRQKWREGVGFFLVFWSPDRAATTPSWTFGPDEYAELPVVRRTLADIRNVVEVVYSDFNNRDATGQPRRITLVRANFDSIDKYGRRYMQIVEASNSNINTATEATRLGDAAIADLSDAPLEVEVRLNTSFWPVEVGDMVRVLPDGVSLGEAQTLAVTSVDHAFTSDGLEKTTLKLRGKPATSRLTWMERDAAPGVGPLSKLSGPDAPGSLQVASKPNGAVVTFAPAPSGPAWDSYELHVSTSSGFTPSSATLKASASTTRFEVADLVPGTAYYARVVPRTLEGNLGTATAEFTLSPRYVAPVDLQPYVNLSNLPPNPDFEAATGGTGSPPDAWTMRAGGWGLQVSFTADAFTGTRALYFTSGGAIASQVMAVRSGTRYSVDVIAKSSDANSVALLCDLEWLDANQNLITFNTVARPGFSTSFQRFTGVIESASTARYARVVFTLPGNSGAGAWAILDSCVVALASSVEQPETAVSAFDFAGAGGGWTSAAGVPAAKYYKTSDGHGCLAGNVGGGGVPGNVFVLKAEMYPSETRTFITFSTGGTATVEVRTDGRVRVLSAASNARVCLDGIVYRTV